MKKYKKYIFGGIFACLMAVALMAPIEKSEAFWLFSKANKENNANYTGAVANTENNKTKPAPSITIVSPNGGETLQGGKYYKIKWKTKGVSKKEKVEIMLLTPSGAMEISSGTRNTGIYRWKIPANTETINEVKIKVWIPYITDESDGFFSIKSGTQTSKTNSANSSSMTVSTDDLSINRTVTVDKNSAGSGNAKRTVVGDYGLTVVKDGTGSGTVVSSIWGESDGGINCGTDCSEGYAVEIKVALTATPASGSTFAGWTGCTESTGTNNCVVTMTGAKTITANFTASVAQPSNRTLTVVKSGAGSGTVASNPSGINCGTDCSESYPQQTPVALTATPASGSTFAGWTVESCPVDGDCYAVSISTCATSSTCNLIVGANNVKVTANFTAPSQASSVLLSVYGFGTGSGSIIANVGGINCSVNTGSSSGVCEHSYSADNSTVTLTASVANADTTFGGWIGCSAPYGTESGNTCSVKMIPDYTAIGVSAKFDCPNCQMTTVAVAGIDINTGSGTITSVPPGIDCVITKENMVGSGICKKNFVKGTYVTLIAKPNEGSEVAYWGGKGNTDRSDANKYSVYINPVWDYTSVSVGLNACSGACGPFSLKLELDNASDGNAEYTAKDNSISCAVAGSGDYFNYNRVEGVTAISGSCSSSYPADTKVVLHANVFGANASYKGVCENGFDNNQNCEIVMDSGKTMKVLVDIPKVTVSIFGTDGFVYNKSVDTYYNGSIGCERQKGLTLDESMCKSFFGFNHNLELVAIPRTNNSLITWVGCDSIPESNRCVVSLNGNKEIKVTFGL